MPEHSKRLAVVCQGGAARKSTKASGTSQIPQPIVKAILGFQLPPEEEELVAAVKAIVFLLIQAEEIETNIR
jgi:hypothetical protein